MKRMHTNQQIEEIAQEEAQAAVNAKKLYSHSLLVSARIPTEGDTYTKSLRAHICIISETETAFTAGTLATYLKDHYHGANLSIPASGIFYVNESDTAYDIVAMAGYNDYTVYFEVVSITDGVGSDPHVAFVYKDIERGYLDVHDAVVRIA